MEKNINHNLEPVHYCDTCLSLKVMIIKGKELDIDYCGKCGNTNIKKTSISNWEKEYKNKTGNEHIIT